MRWCRSVIIETYCFFRAGRTLAFCETRRRYLCRCFRARGRSGRWCRYVERCRRWHYLGLGNSGDGRSWRRCWGWRNGREGRSSRSLWHRRRGRCGHWGWHWSWLRSGRRHRWCRRSWRGRCWRWHRCRGRCWHRGWLCSRWWHCWCSGSLRHCRSSRHCWCSRSFGHAKIRSRRHTR